ncbi:HDOD domain-containing protein [Pelagicoccus sp. SDUM812003]|uniref:HDOD domain-containing protein n=1 Tax=Pelagicoccus sp. SDUM812003 TaxID=3041267 RepID=UPI00280DF342|nr:HDOD domain-containing protein [Pelagicoccus sp. SDUM812003]MDQ8203453.1 HDOD domain-containing protein [Pelagicoccus sp. SDUM812003]
MKTRILIIDEDKEQLSTYQETLAPKSAQWELICADSAGAGLESAKAQSPDIVIVAFSVQKEHGVELLDEIEKLLPNSQRFIAAKEADKPKLDDSFGHAFQFLPNPCPANRLITEIQRCVAIDSWLGNPRIKEVVAKMGEFPSLPPMYLKVVNELNSRNSSAASIANAISGDLAISVKVLQTVNSSYYGFEEKISDITQAVSILGLDCVKNLVLAIQVFSSFGRSPDHKAITDQLWHHSMSVAVASKRIALFETEEEKQGEEAYTAGLMHDLGKLILLDAEPESFLAAREQAKEKNLPLWQVENEILGCNHAEIGAYVLGRWGMPASVVEAVALHHEPINSFGKRFSTLAAVHVANALVWERHPGEAKPDAAADETFLIEIGKVSSWETWKAVVSGREVEQPKKSLSLKKQQAASDSPRERPATSQPKAKTESASAAQAQSASASSASSVDSNSESPEAKGSTLAPIGFALAACAGVAAGLFFLLKPAPQQTIETPRDEADITFADSLEKARDIAGVTETEDALQEIFDSQDPEIEAAKASPDQAEQSETSIASSDTSDAEETPASDTTLDAAAEPVEEFAENVEQQPAASPEPKLPEANEFFPNVQLAGIFYNAANPLASINGRIRRAGDVVDGVEIVRIEKLRVIVRYQNEVRALKLN